MPAACAEQVGSLGRRLPARRRVVDDDDAPDPEARSEQLPERSVDGHQRDGVARLPPLEAAQDPFRPGRPVDVRAGVHERLVAVVDDHAALGGLGAHRRRQPGQVMAVVDVGRGGGGGRGARPAEHAPAPADQPVEGRIVLGLAQPAGDGDERQPDQRRDRRPGSRPRRRRSPASQPAGPRPR